MKYQGNVALVVGSATGMGRATVTKLVKEGAHVIAFDLLGDKLDELKEELRDEPGTLEAFVGDVNDAEKRRGVVAFIKEKYATLDTLAYIAGVLDFMTPVHALDDALWDYVMDVNVNSTFRMVREALPLLKDHKGKAANIVIVASVGGVFNATAGAAYITSKHAVLGLMKHLAFSYKDNNIRVNAVNPGAIATSILENAMLKWPDRDPMHPEGVDMFVLKGANAVSGGLMGDPEDIADAICFLISDEAKFICGAELTVDGGWTTF
jgi:NAD(P)-dependent dehydrogenase (short-subunit alcohol dehydrogenase family)